MEHAIDSTNIAIRAHSIIRDNACLKPGETLLIVTDEPTETIGRALYQAARADGHRALIIVMPEGTITGEEPPSPVAAAMKEADVVLCPTAKSLTHTNARIEAARTGSRVITMPGITPAMMMQGAACADYARVEALTKTITDMLSHANVARIEKDGHVLELDLSGRRGIASPGVYREPGACGNFPSGEAYIAPRENGSSGTMAIDGSMVGVGVLDNPLVVTVESGRLVMVEGENDNGAYANQLAVLLEKPENGVVAELGIGTNEAALLCGIILEDEKLYGTVHIAFGTNTSFGGENKADCHYDGIILKPTLYLDDRCVIDRGVFQTA